jgi:formylglycine-generating enzyme required for sulfatase activity
VGLLEEDCYRSAPGSEGLGDWSVIGAYLVDEAPGVLPDGVGMLVLSANREQRAVSATAILQNNLPSGSYQAMIRWKLVSQEFPERCGISPEDSLEVRIEGMESLSPLHLSSLRLSDFCSPESCGTCGSKYTGLLPADQAYGADAWMTDWREEWFPFTLSEGQTMFSFELRLHDYGTPGTFTAAFVSQIAFVPCESSCGILSCGTSPCGENCGNCTMGNCLAGQCCVPDCSGRVCGNNGCGTECGICPQNSQCQAGLCVTLPYCGDQTCDENENCDICPVDCGCTECGETCESGVCTLTACAGRECGSDGCGGNCGSCDEGILCHPQGHCVTGCDPAGIQFSGDVIQKINYMDIGLGGFPGEALDIDGNPDTCAPEGDCADGINNQLSGLRMQVSSFFDVTEEYHKAIASGDLVRLFEAYGWNTVGTEFTLKLYHGAPENDTCDVVNSICRYYVDPESMDALTCESIVVFDNARVVGSALTAGGPGYEMVFRVDRLFDAILPSPAILLGTHVRLAATVNGTGTDMTWTGGLIGAAIRKDAIMTAVDNLPPDLDLPVSPAMLKNLFNTFIVPDIDSDNDGELDSASIGLRFTTIVAEIVGVGGSCGICSGCGETCRFGVCTFTACDDKECGSDGCGGSCGICSGCGETCRFGVCTFTACDDKECGSDGCGGSCGSCGEGLFCVGGLGCFDNEYGVKWVSIPGGTFQMGCSPGDTSCYGDEKPFHAVTLSSFQMLETEVTESQYSAVVGTNPSCNWNGGGGPNNPVECVTWYQAKEFCEAIGGRLPTEAEWEYAARGGTTTKYYCGDSSSCLGGIAWYSGDMKQNVKAKTANAYGLYDMLGNVWEWTADWYSSSYYSSSPSVNPTGPASGSDRVARGGSFYSSAASSLRVSYRLDFDPSAGYGYLGFRCARDAP